MSRGLGEIQQGILYYLQDVEPGYGLLFRAVAGRVFDTDSPTPAQYKSTLRAIQRLAKLGHVRTCEAPWGEHYTYHVGRRDKVVYLCRD